MGIAVLRVRLFAVVAVLCSMALVASACGGGSGDEDPALPDASVAQTPDTGSEAGETPGEGSASSGQSPDGPGEGPGATPVPTPPPEPLGPPHTAELPWGNFALADRIADKLASGEQLNFVLSVTATGESGSGEAMGRGWSTAAGEVDADVNPRVIGPNSADRAAQIETIDSLISAGSIDCLAVEVDDPGSYVAIIDRAVDAGIPVFTVGVDSADSKRFAFHGLDDRAAGRLVGTMAGEWAAERRILMRKAGVLTGDVDNPGFQARMQGFIEGLLDVHSGIEFVNGPDVDIESLGFDPESVYAATEAWVLAHLDVDMIFHTDQGMAEVARVIADQSLYGDVFTSGFYMNEQMANFIRDGVVVVAVAQGLFNQAHSAATACGDFLVDGDYEIGHVVQEPLTATRDNVEAIDWTLPENQ